MILCLDDALAETTPWSSLSAKQLLAGGEYGENASNRWYDKTIQFIVGELWKIALFVSSTESREMEWS